MVTKKKAKKKVAKKVAKKAVVKKEFRGYRFAFTGDPVNGEDPNEIRFFGYLFKLNGDPVVVEQDVAEKLRKNSHFTDFTEY